MHEIQALKEKVLPILKRYDVVKSGIFGSYAAENPRPGSDLDLLVEFKGRKSLLDLVGLKLDLEEILQKKVDVVTYNSLYPKLRKRILAQEIRIL